VYKKQSVVSSFLLPGFSLVKIEAILFRLPMSITFAQTLLLI